jgi:plasmid stabilization system protein ParE
MKVVWTEGAAQDLTEIVDYIADDSPEAARRVAKHIFDALMKLQSTPYIGRKRTADSSRELVFAPWPYVAVDEVIGDAIYIKGVRHTARNWNQSDPIISR